MLVLQLTQYIQTVQGYAFGIRFACPAGVRQTLLGASGNPDWPRPRGRRAFLEAGLAAWESGK